MHMHMHMHMRLRVCLSIGLPRVGGHDARQRERAVLLLKRGRAGRGGGRGWPVLGITELRLVHSLVFSLAYVRFVYVRLLGRLGCAPCTSGMQRVRDELGRGERGVLGVLGGAGDRQLVLLGSSIGPPNLQRSVLPHGPRGQQRDGR